MPITNTDPMLGHEATITNVQSGGFVVRQMPAGAVDPTNVAQLVDTYAANMDAVSDLLTQIFTPTP